MAKKDDLVKKLRGLLPQGAVSTDDSYRTGACASIQVGLERLREVASVFNDAGFYLESETALDFEDTAELVYHFNCFEPSSRVVLHVPCPHGKAAPTLSDIFATAQWQEREIREFFGIDFSDNSDLRNLLLPEDADYHPLKKTFGKIHAYLKREEIYG